MNLLQHSWLDILCFNLSYRSTPYNGQLVFADDFKLSQEKASLFKSPVDFDHLSRKLAKKVTLLGVTSEEYVLIKALVLCNPGTASVLLCSLWFNRCLCILYVLVQMLFLRCEILILRTPCLLIMSAVLKIINSVQYTSAGTNFFYYPVL